jgi:hypothetical protein
MGCEIGLLWIASSAVSVVIGAVVALVHGHGWGHLVVAALVLVVTMFLGPIDAMTSRALALRNELKRSQTDARASH